MVVMRTNLLNSSRRDVLEDAIHDAIGDREGDGEWAMDLCSHKNARCLSLTVTGPIGAWHKEFYEKNRVAIGRVKATVKDEIDRRLG